MAKVLTFKKYPDLLCNHDGAQFVNIGYSVGTTSNGVPYEAELWYDHESLCIGVVLPFIKEFGEIKTELPPSKKALPKVINFREAKAALAKTNSEDTQGPDFSMLCVGMVDDGVEVVLDTIKNYVDFIVAEKIVEFTSDDYHGAVKYRVNAAGSSVAEVMIVLKKLNNLIAVTNLEFKPFPNGCCEYDYKKVLQMIKEDSTNLEDTVRRVPKVIGFHMPDEEYGCFSNWYLADFKYAGIDYSSVEQFMMYHKVLMAVNINLAKKIMATNDPARIKELASAKYFYDFDQIKYAWTKHSYTIVKRGVRAKFIQNPRLMAKLLLTDNALLVECSASDKLWGNGVSINDSDWEFVHSWKGDNKMGRILMELRREFLLAELAGKEPRYIDALDAEAIYEWTLLPAELSRYPEYHNTIYAFADTLSKVERNAFLNGNGSFAGWEKAMRYNMGGGLRIEGFFEMKQDIYDIANMAKL